MSDSNNEAATIQFIDGFQKQQQATIRLLECLDASVCNVTIGNEKRFMDVETRLTKVEVAVVAASDTLDENTRTAFEATLHRADEQEKRIEKLELVQEAQESTNQVVEQQENRIEKLEAQVADVAKKLGEQTRIYDLTLLRIQAQICTLAIGSVADEVSKDRLRSRLAQVDAMIVVHESLSSPQDLFTPIHWMTTGSEVAAVDNNQRKEEEEPLQQGHGCF